MKESGVPADTTRTDLLRIVQGGDPCNEPTGFHLLLGFWFGDGAPAPAAPSTAAIGLRPIGLPTLFEGWWYRGVVEYGKRGNVQLADCDHYTAALVQKTETNPDSLRSLARETYIELYDSLRTSKHSNVVRIWNYFGSINSGNGDRERYRQFSTGRAEAFEELGLLDELSPPGTAIGTVSGDTFSVIALASNNSFDRLENPRQLSAYRYPRQYGPRSPKFSRGGLVSASNHHLYLISGTAAVIGHESAHPGDVVAQTTETLRNIESLHKQFNWPAGALQSKVLRVYLREEADYARVAQYVEKSASATDAQVAFLCGDICRADLLVEIDGAFCSD